MAMTGSDLQPGIKPDFTVDQEDGARWGVYHDPTHSEGFTILTSAGGELVGDQEEAGRLRDLIHRYRAAEIGSVTLLGEDQAIRQELGSGQEATVYSMGSYAVREKSGISGIYVALGELQRMDAINSVIEHGLPRWLKLPQHFAMRADPKTQKTYTLMERVDGGMTVEDVANYPDIPEARAATVERELGTDIDDAKDKVPKLYDQAYEVLADAIQQSGRNPANYLTDWKPRNAVVEGKLATPVAGSHYQLSVIDQYAS